MRPFTESLGQFSQRIKSGGARKPLRLLCEMAEEFGVSANQLRGIIGHSPDAPKPKLNSHSKAAHIWYDPDEVRVWWKSRSG